MSTIKPIVNLTRGGTVCVAALADRPLRRMRGLMGRDGLADGEGMLITPAPSIHTAFMRFSIDAVFLDERMQVVRIVERLSPWRLAASRRARSVLELPAGECARLALLVGDTLGMEDSADPGDAAGSGADLADAPWAKSGERRSGDAQITVSRAESMRVVVASADRQFRSVASLLLRRRDCSVTATANAVRIGDLVARVDADVVVLDCDELSAASVVGLPERVGVVFVSDDRGRDTAGGPVIAKWGPFSDFVAAIELAGGRELNGGHGGQR